MERRFKIAKEKEAWARIEVKSINNDSAEVKNITEALQEAKDKRNKVAQELDQAEMLKQDIEKKIKSARLNAELNEIGGFDSNEKNEVNNNIAKLNLANQNYENKDSELNKYNTEIDELEEFRQSFVRAEVDKKKELEEEHEKLSKITTSFNTSKAKVIEIEQNKDNDTNENNTALDTAEKESIGVNNEILDILTEIAAKQDDGRIQRYTQNEEQLKEQFNTLDKNVVSLEANLKIKRKALEELNADQASADDMLKTEREKSQKTNKEIEQIKASIEERKNDVKKRKEEVRKRGDTYKQGTTEQDERDEADKAVANVWDKLDAKLKADENLDNKNIEDLKAVVAATDEKIKQCEDLKKGLTNDTEMLANKRADIEAKKQVQKDKDKENAVLKENLSKIITPENKELINENANALRLKWLQNEEDKKREEYHKLLAIFELSKHNDELNKAEGKENEIGNIGKDMKEELAKKNIEIAHAHELRETEHAKQKANAVAKVERKLVNAKENLFNMITAGEQQAKKYFDGWGAQANADWKVQAKKGYAWTAEPIYATYINKRVKELRKVAASSVAYAEVKVAQAQKELEELSKEYQELKEQKTSTGSGAASTNRNKSQADATEKQNDELKKLVQQTQEEAEKTNKELRDELVNAKQEAEEAKEENQKLKAAAIKAQEEAEQARKEAEQTQEEAEQTQQKIQELTAALAAEKQKSADLAAQIADAAAAGATSK